MPLDEHRGIERDDGVMTRYRALSHTHDNESRTRCVDELGVACVTDR